MTSFVLGNVDAERVVLGRIIANDTAFFDICDRLIPQHFDDPCNGAIWEAMHRLAERGVTISRSALLAQIGDGNSDIELSTYLASLPIHASKERGAMEEYVRLIRDAAGRRELMGAVEAIKDRVMSAPPEMPIEELQHYASDLIAFDMGERNEEERIGKIVSDLILDVNSAVQGGKPLGVVTGFDSYDKLVGPMMPGQLIVISGETSSGKTSLAAQVGIMLASQGIPTRKVSLEMDSREIGARVMATYAGLAADRILSADLKPADLDTMMRKGEMLIDLPFYVDSKPGQAVGTIQAKTARMQARHGIKVLIVDHLQYVKPDKTNGKEHEGIKQVVDDLKRLAKRLGIVVILISHVHRSVDMRLINVARDVPRPEIGQLYGSSAIEKAADIVLFVHRPIWFLNKATPREDKRGEWEADKFQWAPLAELILNKRRNGRGYGLEVCRFDEQTMWFTDL